MSKRSAIIYRYLNPQFHSIPLTLIPQLPLDRSLVSAYSVGLGTLTSVTFVSVLLSKLTELSNNLLNRTQLVWVSNSMDGQFNPDDGGFSHAYTDVPSRLHCAVPSTTRDLWTYSRFRSCHLAFSDPHINLPNRNYETLYYRYYKTVDDS